MSINIAHRKFRHEKMIKSLLLIFFYSNFLAGVALVFVKLTWKQMSR